MSSKVSYISTNEINHLLMEYFIIEGHNSLLNEFQLESSLSTSNSSSNSNSNFSSSFHLNDSKTIQKREEIKNEILNGNILNCLEIIEREYPIILNDPLLLFKLYQQHFIELISNGKILNALQFASEKISPLAMQSRNLLKEIEQMMCLITFINPTALSPLSPPPTTDTTTTTTSNPTTIKHHLNDSIPLKYLSKFDYERRDELSREINTIILQLHHEKSEPRLVEILKEMICEQKSIKRKINIAFPEPEIQFQSNET